MHRGFHVLAVPSWERKVRVLLVWVGPVVRPVGTSWSLADIAEPRDAFVRGGVPPAPRCTKPLSESGSTLIAGTNSRDA
jgi:NADH dehydrogenase